MDLGIAGKRALVCASSKGLGLGCAEALAEAGVNLVMNARGEEALLQAAQSIREAYGVEVETVVADGTACKTGDTLMRIEGSAASILAAERVALNFAGRLSGTATLTASYVQELAGTKTRITCTRKTTPGLKLVEKLAILHGGGHNHRFSLSDAILIKDNHIAAAGGIKQVLEAVQRNVGHMVVVEIEIDGLHQLDEVLQTGGADVIMFDNMSTEDMAEAVKRIDGRAKTEASGNVTLGRLREIASANVDYISSGALTHSAGTVDFGLDF